MASRSRVSEEIQAGIYLEDLPSRRQEDDDGASSSSMKNFSRPFSSRSHIVPIHDPEGSNIEIPKVSVPPRFRVTDSSSTLYAGTNPSEFGASSYGYTRSTRSGRSRRQSIEEENERRAALDAWQTTRPRSTLGFTPSQLPDMSSAQGLSPGQIKELDWINRHEKRKQKDVPLLYRRHEMVIEEPPDGGCLAWAHAVCGFILTMNTQYVNLCNINKTKLTLFRGLNMASYIHCLNNKEIQLTGHRRLESFSHTMREAFCRMIPTPRSHGLALSRYLPRSSWPLSQPP